MTHRQLVALCSCPCNSSSAGPVPASRYWVRIPSDGDPTVVDGELVLVLRVVLGVRPDG